MSEIGFLSLVEIAAKLRKGELSAVELTRSMLERIDEHEPRLHSYAAVAAEIALEQAQRADEELRAGKVRSPLHGVPVAVKDLCAMEGAPTRLGSPYRNWEPGAEATVVRRLRDAGAVILGKLQLTEGAYSTHHPEVTAPVNPWNENYWTGVSSSGSGVATAAGLCFGSLGTDTGGSIRFPSFCCGLTGLKPTWGRVSRFGVFPLAETLDHVGPMTRSAPDAAAMLGVLAGPDEDDPTALAAAVPDYLATIDSGVRGLRVGYDETYCNDGVAAPTAAGIQEVLRCLRERGAEIRAIRVPSGRPMSSQWNLMCAIETAAAHEKTFPARADEYGPALRALLELGRSANPVDIARVNIERRRFSGALAKVFEEVDIFVSPSAHGLTPTLAELEAALASGAVPDIIAFTAPTDTSGSPALCLPCGFTDEGVPYGLQLIGRHLGEDVLLRAGHAYQQDTDWHRRHPALGKGNG
jgi:amidase